MTSSVRRSHTIYSLYFYYTTFELWKGLSEGVLKRACELKKCFVDKLPVSTYVRGAVTYSSHKPAGHSIPGLHNDQVGCLTVITILKFIYFITYLLLYS